MEIVDVREIKEAETDLVLVVVKLWRDEVLVEVIVLTVGVFVND